MAQGYRDQARAPPRHRAGRRIREPPRVPEDPRPARGGADITLANHPFTAVPGFPAVVGKSTKLTYKDHGLDWQISDKNGFYSPFAYASS